MDDKHPPTTHVYHDMNPPTVHYRAVPDAGPARPLADVDEATLFHRAGWLIQTRSTGLTWREWKPEPQYVQPSLFDGACDCPCHGHAAIRSCNICRWRHG